MRRFGLILPVLVTFACGGGSSGPAAPEIVAGGGATGGGHLDGRLNVYVIDSVTLAPIAGAFVQVGDAAALGPGAATDATGLAKLDVKGKQTVTAASPGHINQTWFDVDTANITIALAPDTTPALATATAKGTVDGWSGIALPPMGHLKVGVVLFSIKDLAAPESALYGQQAMNGGTFAFPKNACFAGDGGPLGMLGTPAACAFELKTRVGAQALYTMVLDYNTNGTLTDRTDDTVKVIAFGLKRGLTFTADQVQEAIVVPITQTTLMNVRTNGGTMKIAGLPSEQVFSILNIGDPEGVAPVIIPAALAKSATPRDPDLPALTGDLASMSYDFVLSATPTPTAGAPAGQSALTFVRAFKLTGSPNLPEYLPLPTNISAAAGTYSFTASTGAVTYVGGLRGDGAANDAWTVALLDPTRVSFTLPTLPAAATGSMLPVGGVTLHLSATDAAGFDPREFKTQDLGKIATRLSTNVGMFTR